MKKILCALFLAALATNVEAATYYVSPGGDDGNPGTSVEAPFLTPQRCAEVAVAGDTCSLRGGVYRSSGTILVTPRSGTVGVPIVFRKYLSEVPVFIVPLKTDGVYGIDISNSSWIVIEGLSIVGGEFGIVLRDGSSHNQLLNNDVSMGHRGGIDIARACTSNLIKGNKVYDNGRINWPRGNAGQGDEALAAGVTIDAGSDYNVVEDNYVYWNHGGGIVVAKAHYTIVHHNVIADNWGEYLHTTSRNNVVDGNFIYLSGPAKSWPVTQGDSLSNADGIAVSIEALEKSAIGTVHIKNNIIVKNRACIRAQNKAHGVSFRRFTISNNTCVANDSGVTIANHGGRISSAVVQNNIITSTDGGARPTIQITPAATATRFRNNIYHAAAGDEFCWGDQRSRSFASWASASGEVRSSFADPLLADATAIPPRLWDDPEGGESGSPAGALSVQHYAPIRSSPAVDAGADLVDSNRLNYRGSHKDIGAVEFCDPTDSGNGDSGQARPVCESTFLPVVRR